MPELELGAVIELVAVDSVPVFELYWSEVPPWFCLEAQPAAARPARAIIASIFFIISPFTSFRNLAPEPASLNQAFTRFVAQDRPQ